MLNKHLRSPKTWLGIASGLLVLMALLLAGGGRAWADSGAPASDNIGSGTIVAPLPTASCGDSPFSSVASYSVPADKYDVYARLGATTAPEADVLYAQSGGGSCQRIGQANLQSEQWTKLGTYDAASGATKGTFQLASLTSSFLQSFNQPTILLVSQSQPACQPTTECFVNVNGQRGAVRANAINGSSDTLFVVRAVNTKDDTIKQVYYYVDNRLAYVRPSLEPFNKHYAGAGKHKLSKVILYSSGQRVIINQEVNRDWVSYSFYNYTIGLLYNQKGLLQYLFGLSVFLLIISSLVRLARALHRRARWQRDHDARITSLPAGQRLKAYARNRLHPHLYRGGSKVITVVLWLFKELPLVCLGLLLVVLLNKYVISINQVSGPSMNSTFADGQTIILNRLGQTYGEVIKRDYVPKRGDVVVFRRIMDVNDPNSANGSELVIKRIIGLPGERVVVKGSVVTIYNKAHPDGFQPDKTGPWHKTMHLEDGGQAGVTSDVDVTLQPGEVFACGDNRPDSIDSRSFGPIKVKDILGNVAIKF